MFDYLVIKIDSLDRQEDASEHSSHETQALAEAFRDHLNDLHPSGFPMYASCTRDRWERRGVARAGQ